MRVGIVTFHAVPNYGATWQAYALQAFLRENGHEPFFINYLSRHVAGTYPAWKSGVFGIHPSDYVQWLKRRQFRRFRDRYFCLCREYTTVDELRNDPPDADVYVCGSDQIWNADVTGGALDQAFFLDFGGDSVKRVSYAASTGGMDRSLVTESTIPLLKRFDAISVREAETAQALQHMNGMPVKEVVDPTLLLSPDHYVREFGLRPDHQGGYILLYDLQRRESIKRVAVSVSKQMGLPILNVYGSSKFWRRVGRAVRPAPVEWLGLFFRATAVVTDSFHGTIFSILSRAPFWVVPLEGNYRPRSNRVVNLLRALHLEDRIMHDPSAAVLEQEIDWSKADTLCRELSLSSEEFLLDALQQCASCS